MGRPRTFDDDVVVERAMQAFWTHGYAETSPALLAEATGIAKGSLYNAFGSKRALFERALKMYDEDGAEFTANFLDGPGSTRDALHAFLRFVVQVDVEGDVRRGCLAVNTAIELAGRDPEIARVVRTAQDHTIDALVARIDRGRRDGDVAAGVDPRTVAEFFMGTVVGLRVMARVYDAATLDRIIDTALTVL